MATYFVRSGASGSATGADWPNAYTNLDARTYAAGDRVYVAHDHSHTYGAAPTVNGPTSGAPCEVLCVDDSANSSNYTAASTPTASTVVSTPTGTEQTTVNNTDMQYDGKFYFRGMIFSSAGDLWFGSAGDGYTEFYHCRLEINDNTVAGRNIRLGQFGTSHAIHLHQTDIDFKETSGACVIYSGAARLTWNGGTYSLTGGVQPTSGVEVTSAGTDRGGIVHMTGVDLSALTTAELVNIGTDAPVEAVLHKCKIASGATLSDGTARTSARVRMVGCDVVTTGEIYRYQEDTGGGKIYSDTGKYRDGGATFNSENYSLKLVSDSNASKGEPCRFRLATLAWTETTDKTLTVYMARASGKANLNNDDVWLEVNMPDSASPQADILTNRAATILTTGSAHATDSASTWTGITSAVKQKMEVSITAANQQKGVIEVWLCSAVDLSGANDELYLDPAVDLV